MKKLFWILAIGGILLYLGLLPFRASDVSKLLPIETVLISRDGTQYRVDVGEGVRAFGKTVGEALDALKERLTGEAFFQTAEQIVVSEDAADVLPEVTQESRFRPAAGLYLTPDARLDAKAVSAYLQTRRSPLTLGQAAAAFAEGETPDVPVLRRSDGGFTVA